MTTSTSTAPRPAQGIPAEIIALAPSTCAVCAVRVPYGSVHRCQLGSDYQTRRAA